MGSDLLIQNPAPRPSDRRFRDVRVPARAQQVCQNGVGQSGTCPRSRSYIQVDWILNAGQLSLRIYPPMCAWTIMHAMDDSPECLSFDLGLALYPIDDLRAKDDFKILLTPVGASTIRQLF